MGKRKRSKKKPLTQEEIWDDSALIQSWDDAVEEYKLYHSIQARGENVDEILRAEEAKARAEDDEAAVKGAHDELAAGTQPDGQPEAEAKSAYEEANDQDMEMTGTGLHGEHGDQQEAPGAKSNPEPNRTTSGIFANMPQLVSQGGSDSSGADEGLRNLMMAWYFAGYYTGLYEGQQRGTNQRL
ncbi:uncharacterized protein BDCG_00367 [Blastomyces dermatitidis ER-3]|uniref:Survival Motor Neuron Gemin2-binding domain-containing protein n=1 Tax=Ajellomyces dermatitidis (strain ER-3 / ATCC MYA-2586) TaxID=559297 RepID=A0ABP2EK95_AJEDR|nr:uncharacterized protein BDCG_00367 [Blastomyces dermatitidis ER-3]EEQ83562.1 hypothetical protein BDCG_00367 [Blastomyces dermatitidis ER-3]